MNVEEMLASILCAGIIISILGWIWLIVRAFAQNAWWGIGGLFIPPIALVFALRNPQRAAAPLVTYVLGGLITTVIATMSITIPIDLKLNEIIINLSSLGIFINKLLRSDSAYGWMENRAIYLEVGGLLVVAFAWLWLIVRAFYHRRLWGFSTLFIPPVGLAFAGLNPRKGAPPLILLTVGLIIAVMPAAYILVVPLDLGEHERMINGERHLTLTGWDRKDYSILLHKPDVVVLQMANPDVTDESLEPLKQMKALRELDLSGTRISDDGLPVLAGLPALEALRLARTAITDLGFRGSLYTKDSLRRLDLTDTQVTSATVKAWREAKTGRQALR